jgi:hypothetical protein
MKYIKQIGIRELAIGVFVASVTYLALWIWNDYNERWLTFTCNPKVHIVRQGDTLWQIVRENCWGNISVAVDEHVKKYGSLIHEGQAITLFSSK